MESYHCAERNEPNFWVYVWMGIELRRRLLLVWSLVSLLIRQELWNCLWVLVVNLFLFLPLLYQNKEDFKFPFTIFFQNNIIQHYNVMLLWIVIKIKCLLAKYKGTQATANHKNVNFLVSNWWLNQSLHWQSIKDLELHLTIRMSNSLKLPPHT